MSLEVGLAGADRPWPGTHLQTFKKAAGTLKFIDFRRSKKDFKICFEKPISCIYICKRTVADVAGA